MCGLVGMAGDLNGSHKNILRELLYFSELRGSDSTGIATMDKNGEVSIKKRAMRASEFLLMRDVDKFIDDNVGSAVAVIGHTRAATTKVVNYETSHPFQYDHIVLAHNGSLRGQGGLKHWSGERMDSQEITYNMSKDGEKTTLEALQGAYALTWFNLQDLSLNIVRNNERPFFFCFSNKGKVMYWASEMWMLRSTLLRASKDIDDDSVYILDTLRWAKIDLTADKMNHHIIENFKEWSFPKTTYSYPNRTDTTGVAPKTGWVDKSSPLPGKPRLSLPTAERQDKILEAMGFSPDSSEPMVFINYLAIPEDTSRGTITGHIVAYPGGVRNPTMINAAIYASSKRVFDAVGQGKYADVKIRGIHKNLEDNTWLLSCDFLKPHNPQEIPEDKDDGPGYDDDVDFDMSMPLVFHDPKKRGSLPFGKRYGYNGILTDEAWTARTAGGCYICSEAPAVSAHASLVWLNDDFFVCRGCASKHNKELALPIVKMVEQSLVA